MLAIVKLDPSLYTNDISCIDGSIQYHENGSGVFVDTKLSSKFKGEFSRVITPEALEDGNVKVIIRKLINSIAPNSGKGGSIWNNAFEVISSVNSSTPATTPGILSVLD